MPIVCRKLDQRPSRYARLHCMQPNKVMADVMPPKRLEALIVRRVKSKHWQ